MMHVDLIAYYEKVFALKQYHHWALEEIESMIPWELEVMVNFLNNYLELQELQRKQAQNRG